MKKMKIFNLKRDVIERQVWDYPYITTIDELRAFIGELGDGTLASTQELTAFMKSPVGKLMPKKLQQQALLWIHKQTKK